MPVLGLHVSPPGQEPQLPPQPSLPHRRPSHLGVHASLAASFDAREEASSPRSFAPVPASSPLRPVLDGAGADPRVHAFTTKAKRKVEPTAATTLPSVFMSGLHHWSRSTPSYCARSQRAPSIGVDGAKAASFGAPKAVVGCGRAKARGKPATQRSWTELAVETRQREETGQAGAMLLAGRDGAGRAWARIPVNATRGGLPAFVSLPPADPNFVARRDDSAE
jgi:hypothetical protein